MNEFEDIDTNIESIGDTKVDSPILKQTNGKSLELFKSDNDRILIDVNAQSNEAMVKAGKIPPSFELAGPRRKIYFDTSKEQISAPGSQLRQSPWDKRGSVCKCAWERVDNRWTFVLTS